MVHSDFLPSSRPAVPDLKTCENWLGSAPLADSREACRAFLALFDETEDLPPPQATYAAILERLRASGFTSGLTPTRPSRGPMSQLTPVLLDALSSARRAP